MANSKNKRAQKVLENSQKPEVRQAIEKYRKRRKASDMKVFDKYRKMETATYGYVAADIDFSLFNMLMGRIDFAECDNDLDGMQVLYQGMWPFMAKLINENLQMKTFIVEHAFDRLEDLDPDLPFYKALLAAIETETNPNVEAKTTLLAIQQAAKIASRTKTPSKERKKKK